MFEEAQSHVWGNQDTNHTMIEKEREEHKHIISFISKMESYLLINRSYIYIALCIRLCNNIILQIQIKTKLMINKSCQIKTHTIAGLNEGKIINTRKIYFPALITSLINDFLNLIHVKFL